MGATKEKLLRTLDILKTTDEQHPITTAKIIELLNGYGLEPERKSVLRDIKLLRDYGYDIEVAADNKEGFYLGERDFEDWELKILIDAVLGARFLNQDDTDRLVDKLCALASDDTQRTLRFMTVPGNSKVGEKSIKNSIDTVMHAMRSHNKVHFDYVHTDDSGRTVPKHPDGTDPVSPYALIWRKDRYYLIGSYTGDSLSYYRLDRIRNAKELEGERAIPIQDILGSDYNAKLHSFVKQNIYNKKGKTVLLRLALLRNGRDEIFDSFGEDATVIRSADGTVDAYVSVSDSEGLYEWLMRHSSEFSVLEPPNVRDGLAKRLKMALEHCEYSEDKEETLTDRAIAFAVKAHAGTCRKETSIPYIVHPVEVMKIVDGITENEEVRAAAVLHDTVEDTGVTREDIERNFGRRVAELVASESEDKRKDRPEKETWRIRKQETLDHLAAADYDTKVICLGDKLANMRDIKRDFDALGNNLWTRFNAPEDKDGVAGKKANIGWYYRGIADRLKDELGKTAAWNELDRLVKEVFGLS